MLFGELLDEVTHETFMRQFISIAMLGLTASLLVANRSQVPKVIRDRRDQKVTAEKTDRRDLQGRQGRLGRKGLPDRLPRCG